jgi:hypothetical protein
MFLIMLIILIVGLICGPVGILGYRIVEWYGDWCIIIWKEVELA